MVVNTIVLIFNCFEEILKVSMVYSYFVYTCTVLRFIERANVLVSLGIIISLKKYFIPRANNKSICQKQLFLQQNYKNSFFQPTA